MKRLTAWLLPGLLLLLTACGSPPVRDQASELHRVGILNLFQDLPSYSKHTATDDVMISAQLPAMRGYLTRKVADSLKEHGIEAVEVRDHLPLLRGQVDMILELQPALVTETDEEQGIRYEEHLEPEGKNGYGYYYKSLLLLKRGPESFLDMRVMAVVNDSGELNVATQYRITRKDKLPVPELPNSWDQLSENQLQELTNGLQNTIDNGVATLVSKMKL